MLDARDSNSCDNCQLQNAAERDSVRGHTGLPNVTVTNSAINEAVLEQGVSASPSKVAVQFLDYSLFESEHLDRYG